MAETVSKWEAAAKADIKAALRRFTKPLQELVSRDANEGDTRLLVTDMLCDALGYDKYDHLTTEYAVRGEFADYGIRVEKQLVAFIEVKRAAQKLGARHLRQVETYAVKEGVEWVILTNGQVWQMYNVVVGARTPVSTTLAFEVDLLDESTSPEKTEKLFLLHRDAMKRDLIAEFWRKKTATSAPALTQVLLSETVLDAIRKEVRRASNYNPPVEDIALALKTGIIRPELLLK